MKIHWFVQKYSLFWGVETVVILYLHRGNYGETKSQFLSILRNMLTGKQLPLCRRIIVSLC